MDALVEGELVALQRAARSASARTAGGGRHSTQASRYAITPHRARPLRQGRARRSRSGPTTPSRSATSTTSAPTPPTLLRPRGAGHRPPGHVVRAQPGGGHARGLLKPRPPRRQRPRGRRAPTRYLAEEALESAAGGRRSASERARRRAGLPRRRDDLGARARGRAHGLAVRRRGARSWCATPTRSRAKARRCAAYLDDPTPGVALS